MVFVFILNLQVDFFGHSTGFLPEMTRSKTATMARRRRTWIKLPAVPVISPSSHRMISITASVYNIKLSLS